MDLATILFSALAALALAVLRPAKDDLPEDLASIVVSEDEERRAPEL